MHHAAVLVRYERVLRGDALRRAWAYVAHTTPESARRVSAQRGVVSWLYTRCRFTIQVGRRAPFAKQPADVKASEAMDELMGVEVIW